jgi:hypothetical protein
MCHNRIGALWPLMSHGGLLKYSAVSGSRRGGGLIILLVTCILLSSAVAGLMSSELSVYVSGWMPAIQPPP